MSVSYVLSCILLVFWVFVFWRHSACLGRDFIDFKKASLSDYTVDMIYDYITENTAHISIIQIAFQFQLCFDYPPGQKLNSLSDLASHRGPPIAYRIAMDITINLVSLRTRHNRRESVENANNHAN